MDHAQLLPFALLVWGFAWLVARSEMGGLLIRGPLEALATLGISAVPGRSGHTAWWARLIIRLHNLAECAGCLGFWFGLFFGWGIGVEGLPFTARPEIHALAAGVVAAGLAIFTDALYFAIVQLGGVAYAIRDLAEAEVDAKEAKRKAES